MSLEKFSAIEDASGGECNFAEALGSADAVGARLVELGWTKEQMGSFASAVKTMAEMMKGATIELAVTKDENGNDVAEVTISSDGEGGGFDLERIPMKVFVEADPEFFAKQHKVILRRQKDRALETDSIE